MVKYSQKDGVGKWLRGSNALGISGTLVRGDAGPGVATMPSWCGITGTETADYYARLLPTIIRQQRHAGCRALPSVRLLPDQRFWNVQAGIDAGSLCDEMRAFWPGTGGVGLTV